MEVFKINTAANVLESVKDIGSRAFFVGDYRCLSVDAGKFTSVDANCIYYVDDDEVTYDICIYSLKDGTEVRIVGEAIDSLNPFTLSCSDPPFTVVQLLCCHTFQVSKSELANSMLTNISLDRIVASRLIDYDYEGLGQHRGDEANDIEELPGLSSDGRRARRQRKEPSITTRSALAGDLTVEQSNEDSRSRSVMGLDGDEVSDNAKGFSARLIGDGRCPLLQCTWHWALGGDPSVEQRIERRWVHGGS
ncbi:hypothetical protein PR202_ga15305 [Eleusine coracana subsp. coracana]|uniref:KIB1-4 beta-propeller domain-containing protein n=1 Tax=Eleusine coracana subsp. coracana TaxID=191504 RepID=A0AAV5CJJ6_ELECO|nr:hypothetical protein PR202_ga15305 [Eleusine coracana subsp. coracana]